MLRDEEISFIRSACADLPIKHALALAFASAHRILPVYQAYTEMSPELTGHYMLHDGLVAGWRVLRGRAGASADELNSRIPNILKAVEFDADLIRAKGAGDGVEPIVLEGISTSAHALTAQLHQSRDEIFDAVMGALDVDLLWAEFEADHSDSTGIVSWAGLRRHYSQVERDIAELSETGECDATRLFAEISTRAEREGMVYLLGMRRFLSSEI